MSVPQRPRYGEMPALRLVLRALERDYRHVLPIAGPHHGWAAYVWPSYHQGVWFGAFRPWCGERPR